MPRPTTTRPTRPAMPATASPAASSSKASPPCDASAPRRGQYQDMRRTLTWHFDLPPDRLWPVLAATDRFNEAMGLPPYVLEETPQPNGTVLRRGQGKAAGYTLAWEEKPYEWILN